MSDTVQVPREALVEHVARALCAASYIDPDEPDTYSSAAPTPKRWEGAYAVLAEAAIAAIAVAAPPQPEPGWQEIASAPKDGTSVDLWAAERERYVNRRITDCYFWKGQWVHPRTIYDDENVDDTAPVFCATHWMPLPAPPKETKP